MPHARDAAPLGCHTAVKLRQQPFGHDECGTHFAQDAGERGGAGEDGDAVGEPCERIDDSIFAEAQTGGKKTRVRDDTDTDAGVTTARGQFAFGGSQHERIPLCAVQTACQIQRAVFDAAHFAREFDERDGFHFVCVLSADRACSRQDAKAQRSYNLMALRFRVRRVTWDWRASQKFAVPTV